MTNTRSVYKKKVTVPVSGAVKPALRLSANSVAIVGASPDENKLGGKILRFLRKYNYRGRVYAVNPKCPEIDGISCFPTVASIQDALDLVVIAVPSAEVAKVIRECVRKGVKQAVVFSSGFAEIGPEGADLENVLGDIVRNSDMRLIGPNALGIANIADGLIANFSQGFDFGTNVVKPGLVGFVSQSGAFGTLIFTLASEQGIGFKYFACTGNEVDVTITECIASMINDSDVNIVAGYVESIRDGRQFLSVAEQARQAAKPLILIKTGRTPSGSAAALSHTAAIAGSEQVYEAAFHQTGVVRVNDEQAMLDLLHVMHRYRDMAGRRVGVLSNSGGAGVLIADALEIHGLTLSKLQPHTIDELKSVVPTFGSVRNPVDLTGQFLRSGQKGIEILRRSIECLINDADTDAIILYLGLARARGALISEVLPALTKTTMKPIVVAWTAGPKEPIRALREAGVPVIPSPTRSVRALASLADFADACRFKPRSYDLSVSEITHKSLPLTSEYSEAQAKLVLKRFGVQMPNEKLCQTEQDAIKFAEEIGYPVAIKASAQGLLHKTEIGAVLLGVRSKDELIDGFHTIIQNINTHTSGLHVEGILVSAMVQDGVELIVGAKRDPIFGPIVMAGAGGIYTEVFRDAAIRVLPISNGEAEEMLRELRVYSLLEGHRGKGMHDVSAASHCIEAVARVMITHPQIQNVEINPLRVFSMGQGAVALDAVLQI